MKYLKRDFDERNLTKREDLQDYIEFRAANDKWIHPFCNECTVSGIGIAGMVEKAVSQAAGFSIPDNDVEESQELEARLTNKLLLVFPEDFSFKAMSIRYTAFRDVLNRSGFEKSSTLEREVSKEKKGAMPPLLKGIIMSLGLSLNQEECNLLIRDEKVSAMKSAQYRIFRDKDVVEKLESYLTEEFPEFTYAGGHVNHEYLLFDYMLNATDQEESFRMMLEDLGVDADKLGTFKIGVQVSTSDVGNSSITFSPFYIMNGVKAFLAEPLKVPHLVSKDVYDIEEFFPKIAAAIKESEDDIETLGNTPIHFPKKCVEGLVDELKLPKTESKDVQFDSDCTAMDVYFALFDVIQKAYANTGSLSALINNSERIAKLLKNVNRITVYDKE